MNRKIQVLVFALLLISAGRALPQVPFTATDIGSDYTRAMELYGKEKYSAAIKLFDSFIKKGDENILKINEAEYFRALSTLNLFNPDGEYRMVKFIRTHPESPRINEAWLALADYFYQNKTYRKAAYYYDLVNRQELSADKLPGYFFRYGYSLYIKGDKQKALLMFSEIKDIDTEYTPPALYYFSQIAYEQKMYVTAMEGFTRLKNDETFGSVVPFYIVQMLYLQKNYDEILRSAPDLLKSAGKERSIELYRFIGDAYYNKQNYKEALPWLEKFSDGTKISGREDKYELGYCYYKTGDIDKAISTLLSIGSGSDFLSQNIWYILGDCYIQKGNKKRAQFGFSEASKLDFDKKIKEDALFNYAKITYELSYSPFGEVIAAFNNYIDQFPGSDRIEEAYNYLITAYLQSKNYKAALSSLDKIRTKNSRLEEAYQRVAFYRGLEMFRNLEFDNAVNMFDKSLKYQSYNRQLRARAVYWRGEASYRTGNYEQAKNDYIEFIGIPGSSVLDENKLVRYNLGYTCFNLKNYNEAITHLKAFESDVANMKSDVIADARNRIADCYYLMTNYSAAISYYDKVIDYGKTDADYAMFQKGFSLGLTGDQKGKADVLSTLTIRYPSSPYIANAIFERGKAYLAMKDYTRGEADFNTIINSFQSTPFAPQAMVQLGLLYYNLGEDDKAIAQYKKVVETYKSTPEARYAMTGLKNVYVDQNDVDSYFAYVKTLQGYGDVNLAQKDSLVYTQGENLYMTAKYDRAAEVFRNYLNDYPNGNFLQNAKYYLAECYSKTGNKDEALKLYVDIAGVPNNQFTEHSLIAASQIFYDKEDFKSALDYYGKLEAAAVSPENKTLALGGELRSAYQLGDAQKTIAASDKILSGINIPEELTREAVFMKAKANYSLNNFNDALIDFRKIATEVVSAEGAESKYRVAEIQFRNGQTDESERIVNEFIDQNTPHQYWMARMFLLLSDICVKKGDLLQARATLQSLKDYYTVDNDGILDEVKARLDALKQGS